MEKSRIANALKNINITDHGTEIYPEASGRARRFKIVFSSNSTFVTFSHLIRAMLGPTILAIPRGFKLGGLAFSPVGFFFLLVLATCNMRTLILNADFLSEREHIAVRTFDEVAFVSFDTCTPRTKRYAKPLKITVNILFVIAYLDACVIFMIFISRNIEAIINHYFPHSVFGVRFFIYAQVIFMMSMSSIRTLKRLSPFSLIASILLVTVVFILVVFYFTKEPIDFSDCDMIGSPLAITHLLCVVLFCQSGISIALTLKSSMKNPKHFMSFPGIFYISVVSAGILFSCFGFMGYMKYGSHTKPSVLLNVPFDGALSLFTKILAIISVLFTSPLVFYVAFNVLWNNFLKEFFDPTNVLFVEFCIRYALIIFSFLIAMAFPYLGQMIVLKGAVLHSQLELTIPPILDYVTNYPEKGSGRYHIRLIGMILYCSVGVVICILGIIVGVVDWALPDTRV